MNSIAFVAQPQPYFLLDIETINQYFKEFELLAKSEKWKEIITKGTVALEAAKNAMQKNHEAKICAQLTSSAFYLGNYDLALKYATRCRELSENFEDLSLFTRSLYLESAIHRAIAGKNDDEQFQRQTFELAVRTAEKAIEIYLKISVENENLKGKVFFNLGAAHADNPKGDLVKAVNCYMTALDCFKKAEASEDLIRTQIRLGKVYLLQRNFNLSNDTIQAIRSQILNERIAMHTDYLEAQLKLSLNQCADAFKIANQGLERARILNAKEDENRLTSLIQKIKFTKFKPLIYAAITVGNVIVIGRIVKRIFILKET